MAHAKLRRSIEHLIGQSEKPARGSEEVILPTQQVVSLARQDVDDVTLELHVCRSCYRRRVPARTILRRY